MKLIGQIQEIIKRTLNADEDPINRARIYILFYAMLFTLVFSLGLTVVYAINGPPLQLIRIILVVISMIFGLYNILVSNNYRPGAHIIIILVNMLVWSNIFVIIQAINIVTIQYILVAITCSFYLLNTRFGIFYSLLTLLPVVLYFGLRGTTDIQVYITAQQASDPVFLAVLLFNFFILIFISYHFLRAFHFALDKLRESQRDEKLLNEKLKDAIAIAEASARSKSDFLSTMTHELRTPLNSVIGLSYLLMADNPRKDQEENLKVLHFSAESLLSLINDILDFNKLEYGKIQLESTAFNPSELITSIYHGLKHQAEEKGLLFTLNIDDRLKGIELTGDPTRLLQVLFNLVGNAIKFTLKGEVMLSVEIADIEADFVTLDFAVKDTGIGIPEDQRRIIFEPFSQASSNITRKFGGTGLGLAITKQLLELQGSQIEIESEEGRGTVFRFNITYSRIPEDQVSEDPSSAAQNPLHAGLADLQILVAEDNSINTLLMKKLLSSWGIKAEFVSNGREAVEMACAGRYDIILMDIHMPVMDGYEATRRILSFFEGREKPWIIALTASVTDDVRYKVTEAGLNDYVSKPFTPLNLKTKLGQVYNMKRNRI